MKILYVDDEEIYRASMALGLKKYENITTVSDEKSALELIADQDFEVVITDGNLLGASNVNFQGGKNVARAAKSKGSYVIGASSEPRKFKDVAKDYLDVILKKPVEMEGLFYAIENKPVQYQLKRHLTGKKWSKLINGGISAKDRGGKLTIKDFEEGIRKYNQAEKAYEHML